MLYWTGVGRYTKALLENLEQLDKRNEYLVLVRKADWKLWEPKSGNFMRMEVNIDPYTFAEQLRLPRLLEELGPDLVHFTVPNAGVFYLGKKVVTVHDLTLLDFDTSRGTGLKKWLRGLKRLPFRLVLWANTRTATAVVTPTVYVKEQLVRRFGVAGGKIHVTPLAADPLLGKSEPIEKLGVGKDFLLYWGNYYPYKNVGSTLDALKLLSVKWPNLQLVLAGKPDYFQEQLTARAKEMGMGEQVKFLGFVSDGELVSLCKAAALLVLPSLSEGFGLQGLEAMPHGVPVLAANASCLPEVYGEAAVYFDPHDPKDQAEKIDDLLRNDELREKLVRAGYDRVKMYSWERTARRTLAAYRNALGLKPEA